MPRYYFHVYNDDITHDDEGAEFADPDAARERAIHEARILAADSILREGHLVLDHCIEIEDQAGAQVATIHFGDVVDVLKTDRG